MLENGTNTHTERSFHVLLLQRALLHCPLSPLFLLALPFTYASEGPAVSFHTTAWNARRSETVYDLHEPLVRWSHGDGKVRENCVFRRKCA